MLWKIKVLTTEKGTKKIQKVIINKEENSENEVKNKDEIINYLVEWWETIFVWKKYGKCK